MNFVSPLQITVVRLSIDLITDDQRHDREKIRSLSAGCVEGQIKLETLIEFFQSRKTTRWHLGHKGRMHVWPFAWCLLLAEVSTVWEYNQQPPYDFLYRLNGV